MDTASEHPDLPAVELIHDLDAAATLLKPPRPALLAALRQPDSASGLARRLGLPRQRLSHHLQELERRGFVELLVTRRRGNFTERILRASARRYLICPEVLGDLGAFDAEDLSEPHAWTSLAAMSARTLSELRTLRQLIDADPPTLTVPNRLRFASAETLDAFTLELTEQLGRLVRKYHDETSGTPYRFILGAYPVSPETVERESLPPRADLGSEYLAFGLPPAEFAAESTQITRREGNWRPGNAADASSRCTSAWTPHPAPHEQTFLDRDQPAQGEKRRRCLRFLGCSRLPRPLSNRATLPSSRSRWLGFGLRADLAVVDAKPIEGTAQMG